MLEMSRMNGVLHPTLLGGAVGTATGLLCISVLNRARTNRPEFETSHNLFFRDFQEASSIKNACMEKKFINLC